MNRPGFVLLAMLGLLLMTSAIALEAGLRTRARLARADALVDGVRVESAARLAVLAAADSVASVLSGQVNADASALSWSSVDTLDFVVVTTAVSDLAAKLHINVANEQELQSFLLSAGTSPREANLAAQSIADWRDDDKLHRARGAEAEWYHAAGFQYAPSDRPVVSFAELGRVRGVNAGILELLETDGSLFGDGTLNVNSASPGVLAALPGMSPFAVASIVRHRSERLFTNLAQLVESVPHPWREGLEAALASVAPRIQFSVRDVEIRVRSTAPRAAVAVHAVAHHTGNGRLVVTRVRYGERAR